MSAFTHNPDLCLALSMNVTGILLFISRVHRPSVSRWFGYGVQFLGLPALTLASIDLVANNGDPLTVANLSYALWALIATVIDHILRLEYRAPRRPGILIPYVITYDVTIGAQLWC